MVIKKIAAAVALALSVAAGSAQGAVLAFQDDDIDFALTSTLAPKTTGTLAVGDVLVSVFEIPTFTINGVPSIPAGSELTGIAAIQIASGTGTVADPWIFAPYSGGLDAVLALGTDPDASVTGGGAGGGATLAMWFNSSAGADNLVLDAAINGGNPSCQSLASCIFEATRGSLFQVDGFAGDPDEIWFSSVTIPTGGDVGDVRARNNTALVATFNAAQTTLFQAGGFQIGGLDIATGGSCINGVGADGCINGGTLSGTITGGAGLSAALARDGAFAHSDFDAIKRTVPEPGVLALFGAALLGFAGLRRRG